jgi:hypothetical protein
MLVKPVSDLFGGNNSGAMMRDDLPERYAAKGSA